LLTTLWARAAQPVENHRAAPSGKERRRLLKTRAVAVLSRAASPAADDGAGPV
jgi:hypothetical protein